MIAKTTDMGHMFAVTQNINPISDNVAKLMKVHQNLIMSNIHSITRYKFSGL